MAADPVLAIEPARAVAAEETDPRARRRLRVLAALLAVASLAFLLLDVTGSWAFALELRGLRLAAMAVVGTGLATATVTIQTLTHNRILTPSIMGFDALYVLLQSVAVFALGALTLVSLPVEARFAVEAGVLTAFALALHRWLLARHSRDLFVLVLVGVVLGTLFTSVTDLVNRLIDPNEFQTLQDLMFASFGRIDARLLVLTALVVVAGVAVAWRSRRELDIVALGVDTAVALGVDHARVVRRQLAIVAVLVAACTALVGPLAFLGLLAANLARQLTGTFRHHVVLPGAALVSVCSLVVGQLLLERLLGFATALSVVISLVGGAYFLLLLLAEARR